MAPRTASASSASNGCCGTTISSLSSIASAGSPGSKIGEPTRQMKLEDAPTISQRVVSSRAEKAGTARRARTSVWVTGPVTTAGTIVRPLASTPSPAEDQRSLAELPLRVAQISDIHCGHGTFDADWMRSLIERVNEMQPDVVLVVGDLTAKGYEWEYEEALLEANQVLPP